MQNGIRVFVPIGPAATPITQPWSVWPTLLENRPGNVESATPKRKKTGPY